MEGFLTQPINATATVPATANVGGGPGTDFVNLKFGQQAGSAVLVELQTPVNNTTLWTVPANKTLYGYIFILGSGNIAVSAATGGVKAGLVQVAGGTTLGTDIDQTPVVIAGGAGGNVLTVNVTSGVCNSVVLFGYWK